jgi:hypothetical protein
MNAFSDSMGGGTNCYQVSMALLIYDKHVYKDAKPIIKSHSVASILSTAWLYIYIHILIAEENKTGLAYSNWISISCKTYEFNDKKRLVNNAL